MGDRRRERRLGIGRRRLEFDIVRDHWDRFRLPLVSIRVEPLVDRDRDRRIDGHRIGGIEAVDDEFDVRAVVRPSLVGSRLIGSRLVGSSDGVGRPGERIDRGVRVVRVESVDVGNSRIVRNGREQRDERVEDDHRLERGFDPNDVERGVDDRDRRFDGRVGCRLGFGGRRIGRRDQWDGNRVVVDRLGRRRRIRR